MGYTKTFKKERYWHIAEALTKIEKLEEGGKLVFYDLAPEEQNEIKWLLYDYFNHKGLTQDYHVHQVGGLLTVRKKRKTEAKFFVLSGGEEPFEDLFRESLQYTTLEEARSHFEKGGAPSELIEELIERWTGVMV